MMRARGAASSVAPPLFCTDLSKNFDVQHYFQKLSLILSRFLFLLAVTLIFYRKPLRDKNEQFVTWCLHVCILRFA